MRAAHRILAAAFAACLVLLLAACAGDGLDDNGSPNVILTIQTFAPIPPVTATTQEGYCLFTVPASTTVTLKNQPKNSLAGESPYNDVVIDSALITYFWDDGETWAGDTGEGLLQSTSGLIPANGSASIPFTPIFLGDLVGAATSRDGHSANLQIVFRGRTLDGKRVQSLPNPPGGAVLSVNSCPPAAGM